MKNCVNCGQVNYEHQTNCGRCGVVLNQPNFNQPMPAMMPQKSGGDINAIKSKVFLIFGIMFAAMFLFIIGSALFMFFIMPQIGAKKAVELNKKRSAETSGTITSYSESHRSGDKYRASSTSRKYTFKYVVNGVTYENEQSWGGDGEKSRDAKVKICFDPADPKSSEFYKLESNKTCGQ